MSRNSLGGAAQLSPYLNFDPSYLQVQFTNMYNFRSSCLSKLIDSMYFNFEFL